MTLLAVSLLALAEMSIFVYQKDGTRVQYVAADVDSIAFSYVVLPEAIDLGLPSGTKWANMNVGAHAPEDYGDYFAWGETTTKSSYTQSNYIYSSNPTQLSSNDDAANVNLGENWRMPTMAEQKELLNSLYTTWTWTTLNGVSGYKITSKVNGNSIFLPAAGYINDSRFYDVGTLGFYWSSSLSTSSDYAYYLSFNSKSIFYNFNGSYRYFGQSVRPVLAE